jgi:hypothetical protein
MAFHSKSELPGTTGNETGGLFIQKRKRTAEDEKHVDEDKFKKPKCSHLGLDVLAKNKRLQKDKETPGEKKKKVEEKEDINDGSYGYSRGSTRISFGNSRSVKERKYR